MKRADGSDFAAQLADPRRHAVADFAVDSDKLLILFGGIAGGVSMPVFEFFRVTGGYPVKRLFLRDPRRAWYLRGLPDLAEDAEQLREAISRAIAAARVGRVVVAGASAGGFAALLFGAWLRADVAVAFSPQTTVGRADRAVIGDGRWPDQIAALHRALGDEHPHYDVRPHVLDHGRGTRFQIHVSANDPLDIAHARRLEGVAGVGIQEHRDGGHRLVKTLRDRGELRIVLQGALEISAAEVEAVPALPSTPPLNRSPAGK